MSGLRETAERLQKAGRFAVPNPERRLACEKAVLTLGDRKDTGKPIDPEPWENFLRRIGVTG